MLSFKNLQTKLFIAYSLVLVTIALLISPPLYGYLKKNIESNIKESVANLAGSYLDMLDMNHTIFNNVSTQMYISRDHANYSTVEYLEMMVYDQLMGTNERLQAEKAIHNFLYLNAAVYQTIHRISLFTEHGNFYSSRDADGINIHTDNKLQRAASATGAAIVDYSPTDYWLADSDEAVFTFIRRVSWNSHDVGYLEVQFLASDLLHSQTADVENNPQLMLLHGGQIIYSSGEDSIPSISSELAAIIEQMKKSEAGYGFTDNERSKRDFYLFKRSPKTGIAIVAAMPESQLFAPLQVFRNVSIAALIGLISVSLFIYYLLARILMHPLKKLKHAINSITLEESNIAQIQNKYQMGEIETINRSFQQLHNRLQDSLNEIVQFRTLQLQTRFDVLQAHINPHFLFNMLGVITVMSDRGQQEAVSETTRKLSHFLRYSVASGSSMTSLKEEVDFACNYLDLMKTRYLHRLEYQVSIPETLLDIRIPKLIIQPLIENSIQHGLSGHIQQLQIDIVGTIVSNRWEITIYDNGVGFTSDKLTMLSNKMESFVQELDNHQEAKETLAFGGMGLFSTACRLYLMFKEQYEFTFGNNEESGAFVSIKGYLNRRPEL